jgi:ABC-type nitrate/sulfonate/bicarbonate transport system permease component
MKLKSIASLFVKQNAEPAAPTAPKAQATCRQDTQWFGIREEVSRRWKIILGIIPVITLLLVWYFLTHGAPEARVLSPLILPSPFEVVGSFHSLWFESELSRSVAASFLRVLCGFAIGCAVAFPLSIAMGSFSKLKATFEPSTIFLAYLPIPALVPLTMSLFGIGETQKVMFLALAFFIYLTPLFSKAVDEVDNVFLQTAYTLGAKRWEIMSKVLFPISFPQIIHAMRIGFGVGWTYIILAEMVAADRGLGQIIIIAQRRGPREHIYLVLLAIVLIAYITDKAWEQLYKYLFPYKKAR